MRIWKLVVATSSSTDQASSTLPWASTLTMTMVSHLQRGTQLTVDNTALEVWRTGEARARGSLPKVGQSPLSATAVSFTHPKVFCPNRPDGPLPRGHLEHYQTLQPPSRCLAFRLHVDKADTADAKAVVAACGSNAIYIWHLEEDKPMQRIERDWANIGRPNVSFSMFSHY